MKLLTFTVTFLTPNIPRLELIGRKKNPIYSIVISHNKILLYFISLNETQLVNNK